MFLGAICRITYDILCSKIGYQTADNVSPEADAVREKYFFDGASFVGLIERCNLHGQGILFLGIANPECQKMAEPVDEFEGHGGFGGGIKAAGLGFLNGFCISNLFISSII